nr:hypothetical protein Iba_chr07cCG14950 [Ipomoea batatas]
MLPVEENARHFLHIKKKSDLLRVVPINSDDLNSYVGEKQLTHSVIYQRYCTERIGERAKMEKGKSEKGTLFPGRKPGSVMPKENKKHVSTMVVEKIGETVTSMLKNNDKKKIKPLSPDDDGH